MSATHWQPRPPTPAEVDAHAEAHPFLRYEKDDPVDTSFTMPAFGLWMHRRPLVHGLPECPRVVMLRRLTHGAQEYIETKDRTGSCIVWTDGEWQPLDVNGNPVARTVTP